MLFAQYGWDHLIPVDRYMPWYKATDAGIYMVCGKIVFGVLIAVGFAVKAVPAARHLVHKRDKPILQKKQE